MNLPERVDKTPKELFCNCRNSKCMKLYCECFSAGQQCGKLCRCLDCRNKSGSEQPKTIRPLMVSASKASRGDSFREGKGCSCRKSFCIKKYCECFQEGVLCTQNCKCVECQNNESMSNRNVLINLKKNPSVTSKTNCTLHPIVLSQSREHINHLINEQNSLKISEEELEKMVKDLFVVGEQGSLQALIERFIDIVKNIEGRVGRQESKVENEESEREDDNEEIDEQLEEQINNAIGNGE